MKKAFRLLLFVILKFLPANADVWQDPESLVNYFYSAVSGNASVTVSPDVSGEVSILSTFTVDGNDYIVSSIGDYAFDGCIGLTYIHLPSSVIMIGEGAFRNCSGLTFIDIPNSHRNTTDLREIGQYAFSGCSNLTSFRLINWREYCALGDFAFADCIRLTSVELNYVKTINASVFSGCNTLSSINIHGRYIEESAFEGCVKLDSLILKGLIQLGEHAFRNCTSLTYVKIDKVNDIPISVFEGCTNVVKAFLNCKQIHGWFKGLTSLKEIVLGEELYEFDDTFEGCSNLKTVSLYTPYIGNWFWAIVENANLDSLFIGNSVKIIDEGSFYYCSNLSSIVVEESNNYYDSRDNCDAIIEKASGKLIAGCKKTIIPNSVESIGKWAFWTRCGLASISIPSNVKDIGYAAFAYCPDLKSVTIDDGLQTIGEYAFWDCGSLNSITIPNSVNRIESYAFGYCI